MQASKRVSEATHVSADAVWAACNRSKADLAALPNQGATAVPRCIRLLKTLRIRTTFGVTQREYGGVPGTICAGVSSVLTPGQISHSGYVDWMGTSIQKVRQLTETEKAEALRLAAEGKTLKEIQDTLMLSATVFWLMREQDTEFKEKFRRARSEGLELLADDLITIPDTYLDVQRARVKSENIKWILSKRKPEIYGEKLDLNIRESVDLRAAIDEAKSRSRTVTEVSSVKFLNNENSGMQVAKSDGCEDRK